MNAVDDRQGHRARRRRQYLSLGLGELCAAAVFAAVAAWYARGLGADGRVAIASAVGPLVVILVAAGIYWLLARAWVARVLMPRNLARAYCVIGALIVVLLAAGLLGVLLRAPSAGWLAFLLLVWAFGVAEFVNYSVWRLAFPVRRWWPGVTQRRTPQLARDVRAGLSGRS